MLQAKVARALVGASPAKGTGGKLHSLAGVRIGDIAPVAPGIRETSTGLTMGESAERMAAINGIGREEQDRWAMRLVARDSGAASRCHCTEVCKSLIAGSIPADASRPKPARPR